ncbi:MAG: hypothetical protein V8S57_00355 [Oscillospiraceae bacterium]
MRTPCAWSPCSPCCASAASRSKISRSAASRTPTPPDAPHHYCALIPIHSRAPLRPGDLRNDLAALPDILTVEEM